MVFDWESAGKMSNNKFDEWERFDRKFGGSSAVVSWLLWEGLGSMAEEWSVCRLWEGLNSLLEECSVCWLGEGLSSSMAEDLSLCWLWEGLNSKVSFLASFCSLTQNFSSSWRFSRASNLFFVVIVGLLHN